MKEIKRIPFTHKGEQYEVVVASDGVLLKAKAMLMVKLAFNEPTFIFIAQFDQGNASSFRQLVEKDELLSPMRYPLVSPSASPTSSRPTVL